MNSSTRPKILFIIGAARSGSTALERELVSRHEDVVGVGELRFVWSRGYVEDQLCSCGAPFSECVFWRAVNDRAFGPHGSPPKAVLTSMSEGVDRSRFMPQLAFRSLRTNAFASRLTAVQQLLLDYYRAITDEADGAIIVDSTKDPSYAYLISTIDGLDVTFLHLVRHPSAVAYSWSRVKARPEIHWKDASMDRQGPVRSTLEWDYRFLTARVLGRRSGVKLIECAYESFASEPDSVFPELVEDIEAALDTRLKQGRGKFHSVAGNPIRFESSSRPIRLDDEWRVAMPGGPRRLSAGLAAPFLPSYRRLLSRR